MHSRQAKVAPPFAALQQMTGPRHPHHPSLDQATLGCDCRELLTNEAVGERDGWAVVAEEDKYSGDTAKETEMKHQEEALLIESQHYQSSDQSSALAFAVRIPRGSPFP